MEEVFKVGKKSFSGKDFLEVSQDEINSSELNGFWIGQKFWKAEIVLFHLNTTFTGYSGDNFVIQLTKVFKLGGGGEVSFRNKSRKTIPHLASGSELPIGYHLIMNIGPACEPSRQANR